jgi:hypothetical protein
VDELKEENQDQIRYADSSAALMSWLEVISFMLDGV